MRRLHLRYASQVLGGPLARALGIIVLANLLFLVLIVAAPGDPAVIAQRIRTAFARGELGVVDFRPFDTRRGYMQYNDCNVLQMLSNARSSRLAWALAPLLYATDRNWLNQCALLHALVVNGADPAPLLTLRYTRYWHGYNALTGFALRGLELRALRRGLAGAVWGAIGVLALATWRSGAYDRRTGLTIAGAAVAVWAVPYFAPGLTHGPGDALLLLALAGLAAWPGLARRLGAIVPYAAGFGTAVIFFEMLTGQLPIAAAWLGALTLAAGRDERHPGGIPAPTMALTAVTAFGLGAAATVLVKQLLAGMLTGTEDGGAVRRVAPLLHGHTGIVGRVAGDRAALRATGVVVRRAYIREYVGRLRLGRGHGADVARRRHPGLAAAA